MEKKTKKSKCNIGGVKVAAGLCMSMALLVAILMYEGVWGVLMVKAQNTNSAETVSTVEQPVEIKLTKRKDKDNVTFKVSNMFPGDKISGDYCVKVSYEDAVVVNFRVDIGKGYDKLAEVLKCKIVLSDTGEVLYDGLMRDVPETLGCALPYAEKDEAELCYQITAYLDTSVGNAYQNTNFEADFVWWIEVEEQANTDTGEPITPDLDDEGDNIGGPDVDKNAAGTTTETDDDTNMVIWLVLAVCAATAFVVLVCVKKRKEDWDNEQ